MFDGDGYLYMHDPKTELPFEVIDQRLTEAANADERYEYLKTIVNNAPKNRFALKTSPIKKDIDK